MNSEIDKQESAKIEGQIEDLLAILAHDEVSIDNKKKSLRLLETYLKEADYYEESDSEYGTLKNIERIFGVLLKLINHNELLGFPIIDILFQIESEYCRKINWRAIREIFLNHIKNLILTGNLNIKYQNYIVQSLYNLYLDLADHASVESTISSSIWLPKNVEIQALILESPSQQKKELLYRLTFNLLQKLARKYLIS